MLAPMPTFAFALVDVFSDAPLSGNPLAVVLDADSLSDVEMRRIAGEFNQPEITFVLGAHDDCVTRRLRSFTASGYEVTGAGHNALGAWWWLAESGQVSPGRLTQQLGDDVLDLTIRHTTHGFQVALRQGAPVVGRNVAWSLAAAPLGLAPTDLVTAPACVVSTGVPHLLVAARDRAAVDAARPDTAALLALLRDADAQGCYLYAAEPDSVAYARFFNPTAGLLEDAATGSAAGPLAWLLNGGRPGRLTVQQGHAMGRPSCLELTTADGRVTLLGRAALTAQGHLHTPDHSEQP